MWRDFLGCLNKSQGTLQAVFRSEPGETASRPAAPQLHSSAVNYSKLQTTTCGALAIFPCLKNLLVPWNFRFLKLAELLVCCQKSVLLERKKGLKKKKPKKQTLNKLSFAYELFSLFCKKHDAAKPREGKGYSFPDSESSYVYPECFFSTCNLKFPPKSWKPVHAAACGASMIALLLLLNKSAGWGFSCPLLKPRCSDNV